MDSQTGSNGHPIRVVSQRTGLTAATLRAWERRYDVVEPTRSDGGHRLYSDEDVRRLRALVRAVDGGRSISQVATLSTEAIERLFQEDQAERASSVVSTSPKGADQVALAFGLVESMKSDELERFLMRSSISLRASEVVSLILVPLLNEIGAAWSEGRLGASSEHLASVTIRRHLEWLTRTVQAEDGGALAVTGTPTGQRHEFGALLAGVIAAGEGWQVRFLGPDLPASEIVSAGATLGASLVALSAVHPALSYEDVDDIVQVRRGLPDRVDVVVGGAAAAEHESRWRRDGILFFRTLDEYQAGLAEIHERRFGALESLEGPTG